MRPKLVDATRRNARKFDEAGQETRKSKYAYTLEGKRSSYAHDEVHAWLAFVEKKNDEAVRQMREVADSQDQGGKAEVDIPAREMLAEMLLDLKQPESALAEYEKSLKIDPNRFNGLVGAPQAAALGHQAAKANAYYGQLLKNCDGGKHSERPELQSARTERRRTRSKKLISASPLILGNHPTRNLAGSFSPLKTR